MPDREQLIKDFEHAVNKARGDYYDYVDLTVEDADEILKLLKEHEPKTVLFMAKRSVIPVKALSGFCPKCNHTLIYGMNKHFFGFCGQEVKWE